MKIHFIGIGGIGMSGLAGFYLSNGHEVNGSDLCNTDVIRALQEQGAKISIGAHNSRNLSKEADLVVYSAAVPSNNPEFKKAKKLGIKTQTYAQTLGDLTKKMFTIAVSGMHGKSTTTAMLGLVLEMAGLDPTVIVGTRLREWNNSNYRVGGSQYLIIEADEYQASFLNYWPKILVLTNIEEEHLDYYKDLNHIIRTFRKYVSHLGRNGILIINKNDRNIEGLLNPKSEIPARIASQLEAGGRNPKQIQNTKYKIINYSLGQKETEEIKKILKVPGEHNVSNAMAVLAAARELKIPDKITFRALSEFSGTWRRMEYKGEINGAKIYDDYGHHPTEIKATLHGARELLNKNPVSSSQFLVPRLWLVFQPHQYQRTYKLFNQFVGAFNDADKVILLPIYSVAGRERESIKKKVNSEMLTQKITNNQYPISNKSRVKYIDSFQKAKNYLMKNLKKGDVCIIMGAGDIYKLTEMMIRDK